MWQEFNQNGLNYLTSLSAENPFLQKMILVFADLPIFCLPIFLIIRWLIANKKKDNSSKYKLLLVFFSTVLAISFSVTIQQFVEVERPENYVNQATNFILSHVPDASFPSDHASASSAFLLALLLFSFRKTALIYFPFVLVMLLSRVMGGVHWPSDIIVGVIIGILSSGLIYCLRKSRLLKYCGEKIINLAALFRL